MQTFVKDLTEIIIYYITKTYQGKTVYTRSEETASGTYNFGEIEVSKDLEDLEYDFSIDLESKTQFSRDRERNLLLELFQFERQYDAPVKAITVKDILKAYDVTNRDELIDRYDQLVTQDELTKANLIQEFVQIANELEGIDPEAITQGIQEIMAGGETPTVDQILQEVEAQRQEMERGMEQVQQQEMEQIANSLQTQMEIEQMAGEMGGDPMGAGMGAAMGEMGGQQPMTPQGEPSEEEMMALMAQMGG
jgi:nicotinamide mononucleotide adenylyltransferase